jgi:ABC-type amino acid transport substrate-binding protein
LRESDSVLEGNDRFEGYLIDLLKIIAEKLEFTYSISLSEDSKYGTFIKETGKWDGIIGKLVDKEVEMVIVPLLITDERQEVIDFIEPFMKFGVSIIYKKSGDLPFKNVEELFKLNGKIPYGVKIASSILQLFKQSENPIYQGIYKWLLENPQNLMTSNQAGLQRVIDGNFAYFMESQTIDYLKERHCNLVQVGGLLDERAFGLAIQKGSPLLEPLNEIIRELQGSGKLDELKEKWLV